LAMFELFISHFTVNEHILHHYESESTCAFPGHAFTNPCPVLASIGVAIDLTLV
jgi:hypothetical protein